jgi:hypothetical protein
MNLRETSLQAVNLEELSSAQVANCVRMQSRVNLALERVS